MKNELLIRKIGPLLFTFKWLWRMSLTPVFSGASRLIDKKKVVEMYVLRFICDLYS